MCQPRFSNCWLAIVSVGLTSKKFAIGKQRELFLDSGFHVAARTRNPRRVVEAATLRLAAKYDKSRIAFAFDVLYFSGHTA